jgi:hypothetical protein
MVNVVRIARTFRATIALLALTFASAAFANHSFNVQAGSVTLLGGQVIFVGGPTAPSALGLSFTGLVCNTSNTTVFVGNSHTFASVGEQFQFIVPVPSGTFSTSELVIISTSETSTAICNAGAEGFELQLPLGGIGSNVPTLHEYALLFVALMLAMIGMLRLRRS